VIGASGNRPWRPVHALIVVLCGVAAWELTALILGPVLTVSEIWRVLVPVQAVAQVAAVAALAALSLRRRVSLGLRFEPGDLVGIPIGIGLLLGISLVMTLVFRLFSDAEIPTQGAVDLASRASGVDAVMVVIGVGLLGPIAEELVFRGVLLRALVVRRGPGFAVWVSAAVFAVMHLAFDAGAWFAVPALFVLGLVLGRQAITTGRLARPIITHAAFNLVSVASVLAS